MGKYNKIEPDLNDQCKHYVTIERKFSDIELKCKEYENIIEIKTKTVNALENDIKDKIIG